MSLRGTHDHRRGRAPLRLLPAMVAMAAAGACAKSDPGVYQGYVEGEFVNVGSGVAGRLEKLFVTRGATVEANAPLFNLESTLEVAAVKQADEAHSAARAQLSDLGTGKRKSEIDVVRAQLEQAVVAEKQSATQLARDEAQLEAGGISRMQLDDSRARHEVNVARARELRSQLTVAEMAARPAQIQAQESQVAGASAAVDESRWRLDQKHVVATQAGVVEDTLYREGEWVPAGSPVVRILPPANVKVRFFVPQPALGRFPLGHEVAIRCDGCAATVKAAVTYVAINPEFTPPIIYSNDTRAKLIFMIEARPAAEGGPALRPGQPVEVVAP